MLDPDGQLQTRSGLPVLGEGGPITIPPDSQIAIGKDGTISATTLGQSAANVSILGQIKLVNPGKANLVRGDDGLFRTASGQPADTDPAVTLVGGALEDSNVNTVGAMIDMIDLARSFDLQMKLMQSVDQNAQRSAQLLTTSA
jgi:flagellar basal-body rod protein FlgF